MWGLAPRRLQVHLNVRPELLQCTWCQTALHWHPIADAGPGMLLCDERRLCLRGGAQRLRTPCCRGGLAKLALQDQSADTPD
eukprot:15409071-Alexandrium_andersonii.AAC.1